MRRIADVRQVNQFERQHIARHIKPDNKRFAVDFFVDGKWERTRYYSDNGKAGDDARRFRDGELEFKAS